MGGRKPAGAKLLVESPVERHERLDAFVLIGSDVSCVKVLFESVPQADFPQ